MCSSEHRFVAPPLGAWNSEHIHCFLHTKLKLRHHTAYRRKTFCLPATFNAPLNALLNALLNAALNAALNALLIFFLQQLFP